MEMIDFHPNIGIWRRFKSIGAKIRKKKTFIRHIGRKHTHTHTKYNTKNRLQYDETIQYNILQYSNKPNSRKMLGLYGGIYSKGEST